MSNRKCVCVCVRGWGWVGVGVFGCVLRLLETQINRKITWMISTRKKERMR